MKIFQSGIWLKVGAPNSFAGNFICVNNGVLLV
jgi:hypothetical protein